MKKFLFKIAIYSLPFLCFILFILFQDPFNMFHLKQAGGSDELLTIAQSSDYGLYKTLDFSSEKEGKFIVVIGDSRSNQLNAERLLKFRKNNDSIRNLSLLGANLREIYDMFWFAVRTHPLKEVYIGLNYDLFSDFAPQNRVKDAEKILNQKYKYFFHKPVILSIIRYYKKRLLNEKAFDKPKENFNEFWRNQIDVSASNAYKNHKETPEIWNELKAIAAYCEKNKIRLVIFTSPTHLDLQQVADKFGLAKDRMNWKNKMSAITQFADFDVKNELTTDKKYYLDPYHLNREGLKIFEKQFQDSLASSSISK